ncbi:MAG: 3-phosphoshikimate 1-carboxyvinyltransferase [Clostridiales bacterium]|jgi:3-phosphoshikimate 1-carboxyvinyltransferase|nr:3-phosphoshikimate 1-carboxyvinyltransferase [Clostridiales bacterium]HOA34525.1 3-phosphoshikimate 1-carboxyvinyltransferase [Clostridiales bacterium]HPP68986.1 3-phosphoshikimate 1-carboxyvinyltransferase [Clostridiales bacterium]HPU67261.1 3-phosphoshikimate 1-carboxyvinyltransferase [Clostridiales bacterium]HQA06183.1 3-phosphoshikimate 1-carboxyvinyltransferase [Clostridiales bacterium]
MDIKIIPRALTGKVKAISSKSDAHRLFFAAAAAEEETSIVINGKAGEDILATINCLKALGAEIHERKTDADETEYTVIPAGRVESDILPTLDCGESGSTARMLLPLATYISPKGFKMTGRGRLPERPMTPLIDELIKKGCEFTSKSIPLEVKNTPAGGVFKIAGNISSQFISGLLFLLPLLPDGGIIEIDPPLQSAGYVDMTVKTLSLFGVKVERNDNRITVKGGQRYISPQKAYAEGDWSSAAFWLCAAALNGSITVTGLDAESAQKDKYVFDILSRMGAKCSQTDGEFTISANSLKGTEIDASEIPDLVPVLSVVCAAAEGESVIFNAGRLRLKESDRIESTCTMLKSLGAEVTSDNDSIRIIGKKTLSGGTVDSFNDHRIAMSAAVASVICENPVIILGAECCAKSYLSFFDDFNKLGGKTEIL